MGSNTFCSFNQDEKSSPKNLFDIGDYYQELLDDEKNYINGAKSNKYLIGNLTLNRLIGLLDAREEKFTD